MTSAAKPVAPPPAAPLADKCGKSRFAAVYGAAAPTKPAIEAALDTLEDCHKANLLNEADYRETKDALVTRLVARH